MAKRSPQPSSSDMTEREWELELQYQTAKHLLEIVAVGGFLIGSLFGSLGVVLVYLGAKGDTTLTLFGQKLSTASVGIASIFIAAVTFTIVTNRVLSTFNDLVKSGAAQSERKKPIE